MYLKQYRILIEQFGMTEELARKAQEHYKVALHSPNKCYIDDEDIKLIAKISKYLLTKQGN